MSTTADRASPASVPQAMTDAARGRRWRPSAVTLIAAAIAFVGIGAVLYPAAASWVSSVNQSQVIRDWTDTVDDADPPPAAQIRMAHEYNRALSAGVLLEPNANLPLGDGSTTDETLEYGRMLVTDRSGLMARVRIPSIDVDLPIYHGTGDATLLRGAGHLEGSHLPVGGEGTHAVITAHRGLANATMFSDLDRMGIGDTFTIEVLGEVLSYRVRDTKVVEPDESDSLRAVPGEDLVTLVTCTPLGINSHRILVTGERIEPTPVEDLEAAGESPDVPGFPWWLVGLGAAFAGALGFVWWSGYGDARNRARRRAAELANPRNSPE